MSVPGIVQSALGDEQVAAQVRLGGEDELYVTPSRIIIYRGEGLLSDEGIEEYTHRAERLLVKTGRRKAKITLEHDLEGDRSFSVQPSRLDDVLHPVLAGVLSAAGVTDAGETVKQTYRFSELTLIVTSKRLVKHIGNAVWDQDYEEFRFEDTTGLDFEEGSVATQIVVEVDGRRERIKAPNEQAPEVRARLEEALFDFYDVASREEFDAAVADAEAEASGSAPDPEEAADDGGGVAFESGLSPLSTDPDEDVGPEDDAATAGDAFGVGGTEVAGADAAGADDQGTAGQAPGDRAASEGQAQDAVQDQRSTGAETAGSTADAFGTGSDAGGDSDPAVNQATVDPGRDQFDDGELAERLDEIARSVNKQNELLKRHQRTMEKLIDELQRMD